MKISLRKVKKTDWDYIMKLRNESYENFYLQEKPLTKNKTSKKIFEKNQYKLKQWWMEKEIN